MSGSRSVRAFVVVLTGYAGVRTLWVWLPEMAITPPPPIQAVRTATPAATPRPYPGTGREQNDTVVHKARPAPADSTGHRMAAAPGLPRLPDLPDLRPSMPDPERHRDISPPLDPASAAAAPRAVIAQSMDAVPPAPATIRPVTSPRSRWSGYAYLFHRGDGGTGSTLAPAGQIGGSQAAARLAYRLDDAGRVAIAARIASPLRSTRQADLAVGADLMPVAGLRLSVERRIAVRSGGRDAFAAYAAGGVYRALAPGIELDGYAQAGIVGVRRRDPFADGALRLHHRTTITPAADLRIGLAGWGAAQPGAARLDVGPRAALTLRTPRLPVTIAVEGRLRVAGRARPGNGIALTLATDF